MIRNLVTIILVCIGMIAFVGCNDDDFAPYKNYQKSLDVNINSHLASIDDITNDVTKIAHKYHDRVILSNVVIVLNGSEQINSGKGTIVFGFYKEHETKNQRTKVLLNYDMATEKIIKMQFEQGHGKRVDGYSDPINNELIEIPISELISYIRDDNEFLEKIESINPRIEIDIVHEIYIQLYDNDKNEGPILTKKINKQSLSK